MSSRRTVSCAVGALLMAAGSAAAQSYSATFEAPTFAGAAGGTPLTNGFGGPAGQDAWYNPVSGSNDYQVITYAGNTFGIPANPAGGDQCLVGELGATNGFGRAQRTINFSSGGKWKVTMDVCGLWNPAVQPLPADNLGSFSLQPSTSSRFFQTLLSWGATAIGPAPNATNYVVTGPTNFHLAIGHATAASPTGTVFETPANQWRDLLVNNWYRATVTWDWSTNLILECTIQDLTGAGGVTTVDVSGMGWYLRGGTSTTDPLPTDVRFFTGGGSGTGPRGNTVAWDNFRIEPVVAACYPDCNGDGSLNLADFGCFQTRFALGNSYADCNGDGSLNLADFGCFQTKFALGCP